MVGGFTIGYNEQMGNIVYGIEGDYGALTVKGDAGPSPYSQDDTFLHTKASTMGTMRVRLGYALDRALIYATAGAAQANFNSYVDDPDVWIGVSTTPTVAQFGLALGAGLEYMLTDRVSIKADYMHVYFSDRETRGYVKFSCTADLGCPPAWKTTLYGAAKSGDAAWNIRNSLDVVRVGMNVKLDLCGSRAIH